MKSILLLIFLISFIGITQTTETPTKKEQRQEKKEIRRAKKDSLQSLPIGSYFTFDLLKLLPAEAPRITLGYVHSINNKWSAGTTLGIGTSDFIFSYKENYTSWELRPQVVYNLGNRRRFHHFLSAEVFYITHKETLFNNEFIPVNTQNGAIEAIAYDRADFERLKYGITLNYGEIINFSKTLALRTIIGGGIRFKDNIYSNLLNPRATESDTFLFNNLYAKEGFLIGFEFNVSLQLIYKL